VKKFAPPLFGIGFITVGVTHFTHTTYFIELMPPYIPNHLLMVFLSGFFEIVLGVGLLFKKARAYSAYGLILLLIAVFPANIHLAISEDAQNALKVSALAATIRLPFQFIFIWIAYRIARRA
jgi:uncharacterized membrane protein